MRGLTAEYGLLGWHIADRDLLCWYDDGDDWCPAEVLVTRVTRLVELGRAFPADLAARFGLEPALPMSAVAVAPPPG